MASRQAWVASARATSKAPSATRRSPPAVPRRCAGTLAARARSTRSSARGGVEGDDHARRRLREPGERGTSSVPERDREPALARDRHLGERDRETAVGHVVHAGDRARDDQLAHELVQRARDRRGRRRAACRREVVQTRPLGTAELAVSV